MLTYGIFLFLSVFPIIHPKGLTPIPEENMENTELLPLGTEQGREETEYSSFDLCLGESFVSPLVAQHRQWLKSIRHETPSPKIPFKVAVYIRFFNQTKYGDEEYLERNKEVFRATLAQYPLWKFVGFYIDNGSTAPYMEKSSAWTELLSDCDEGKVNLIITQKVSNVLGEEVDQLASSHCSVNLVNAVAFAEGGINQFFHDKPFSPYAR